MARQTINMNGNKFEAIDGKTYLNGVDIETGRIKKVYWALSVGIASSAFILGCILGYFAG